jgi:D-alanyl-D-alanine-carboxypeptidase/D-alanyl-D-alanine-endopeptidase
VTRDRDHLWAKLTGQQTFEVHPYTERDFFYTIVAAQLSFVLGPDGKASAVVLHQNGKDQTAPRVDPSAAEAADAKRAEQSAPHTAIKIDPHLLDGYVGRYSNENLEITATREGDQLFMQVTGYGRYAVFPYTDHDFFATIKPIQITFTTDNTGKATQLVRHQNGKEDLLNRED